MLFTPCAGNRIRVMFCCGSTAMIRHKSTVMTILVFGLISGHDSAMMPANDQIRLETFLGRALTHRQRLTEEYTGLLLGSEHYVSNRRSIESAIRELDEIIGGAYVRLVGCRRSPCH